MFTEDEKEFLIEEETVIINSNQGLQINQESLGVKKHLLTVTPIDDIFLSEGLW